MKSTLHGRLLRRELGHVKPSSSLRGIYGDRSWIDNLDIVNELGGHRGCVNALSWSTSGRLLASGSDDQHLNIHVYQPEDTCAPFLLDTTVATGHAANIFSVKFMPHCNDRTLITAAGDAEVRVFDIERAPRVNRREVNSRSEYNTNARVYRSHADRVKRIVTESSPYLFLTCSEDGEVRQFDTRLPSSAYPAPRGGRGFLAHRSDHDSSNVPPPLISYKRYNLDLNTISCSANQPHYIALGGAHAHCFLHDRRMVGRDIRQEQGFGGRASPAGSMTSMEDDMMGQATRCVRRFAPEGRQDSHQYENGHITACKISDANPNELIASWSGDHIYSFDIIRSPGALERPVGHRSLGSQDRSKGKARESSDRKRKRVKTSNSQPDRSRKSSRRRHDGGTEKEVTDMALRVRYENGQTEEIDMSDVKSTAAAPQLESARKSVLTDSEKRSLRIARSLVNVRKHLFSLDASGHRFRDSKEPSDHEKSFTAALGNAAGILPEMDEISKSWSYPVNPSKEDVVLQSTLRANRDSSRRFVQAAGTLARFLGGKLQTASSSPSPLLEHFQSIGPSPNEGPPQSTWEIFRYDFLRAIILWLEGGRTALLEGFKQSNHQGRSSGRFPVPKDANDDAIETIIIPYLLESAIATDSPIVNVDSSRFERNETRHIFSSEGSAVIAFGNAVRMPLSDLSQAVSLPTDVQNDSTPIPSQDRRTAVKYWAFKVGRGLLMNAAEGVNFRFGDTAFGGLGQTTFEEDQSQQDIDPDEDDDVVDSMTVRRVLRGPLSDSSNTALKSGHEAEAGTGADEPELDQAGPSGHRSITAPEDEQLSGGLFYEEDIDEMVGIADRNGEANSGHMSEDDDGDLDEDDEDEDEDSEDADMEETSFLFRSAADRGRLKSSVERRVPCDSHTRQYRGHCNVKTVKDANFFGLQDEYVVSGSDGGHLFIWDRKTSELLNILEGDGEVVNVIQGHPYEPMLAVSGIDHTIKIFSADDRAREDAANGINIPSSAEKSAYGSTSLSYRRRRREAADTETSPSHEGLASKKRMQQSYQIVSQNDVQRQGGMREAYITRSMLAQVAARLRQRRAGAGGEDAGGGGGGVILGDDGETVVLDDNCGMM